MEGEPESKHHRVLRWVGETLVEGLFETETGFYFLLVGFCALVICGVLYGINQWLSDPGTTWASIFPGSTDLDVLSIKPESWKL